MRWAIGVTSVPSRFPNLLPQTLTELARSGFPKPRVFVDDYSNVDQFRKFFPGYQVSVRPDSIRTFGNWVLGAWELYIRDPACDRYVMFQDDIVSCLHVREYLEHVELKPNTYWNLFTFTEGNERVVKDKPPGFYEAGLLNSDPPTELWQTGRGAVGLVFSRKGIIDLLTCAHMVERPSHVDGWKKIDGGIVTAMNKIGYREMIHNPSLLQHVGDMSTMGNHRHRPAHTYPGHDFDARTLLRSPSA